MVGKHFERHKFQGEIKITFVAGQNK